MTTVHLYRHPFADAPPQEFEVESLAAWLLVHYEGGPFGAIQVFAGEPSGATEVTHDLTAILRGDAPLYVVLESPGDPINIGYAIISMVLSAAVNALLAPDPTGMTNRDQQSQNNQLANRENQVRLMERVEDIYGTVRSIPSLMMPTYNKYIANQKVEYGYYGIGRGYYDVSDVRDGDTLVSEVSGASAAVYAPFTSPNSGVPQLQIGDPIIDPVLTVSRSSSVDGIVLKPMNQLQLTPGLIYNFFGAGVGSPAVGVPASAFDIVQQPESSRRPNFSAVAENGQTLTISMAPVTKLRDGTGGAGFSATATAGTNIFTVLGAPGPGFFLGTAIGSTFNAFGFVAPANLGPFTVVGVSPTGESIQVAEALATEGPLGGVTFEVVVDYSGVRTIGQVENGFVILAAPNGFSTQDQPLGGAAGAGGFGQVADLSVDNDLVDWTDWFTLPDASRAEVWTNVLARNGVYKDDGSKSGATVAYEVQIEQLTGLGVPTGLVETVTGSLTGSTSEERAETLERVTAWVGPARVRARRTTPFDYDFGGLVVDEITWADLYGVTPVDKLHFGNKTTVHTVTQANSRATTIRRRELNALVSRKLPIFDGTNFSGEFDGDGLLVAGTIAGTSRMVDIVAAVAADPQIGNDPGRVGIDLTQIYAVQGQLEAWSAAVGQFNYTFDSDALSFEETISTIANAAFCTAYRQNGLIRMAPDLPQATAVAMYSHRNKRPKSETLTRTFANDGEYDGVELAYMDPETESQETIRLPLGGDYTKLKKVEVPGIRDYTQAWYRANRELNRLRYQRLLLETDTTTDARALLPNARVLIVDNTRFKSYDGEVIAQAGLTLTLSRDVEFLPAAPHSIVLQRRDGTFQSIACTAGATPNQVVLAGAPGEAIVTQQTPEGGIRTIFSFAADSARAAQSYLVQEIGISDGSYIRLGCINYADEYYAADSEPVPDKALVIN